MYKAAWKYYKVWFRFWGFLVFVFGIIYGLIGFLGSDEFICFEKDLI